MIMSIFFLCGTIIGSFLSVCIYRIPKDERLITKVSRCTHCNQKIKYYDLMPIFSYLLLKGRCRCCKEKISFRYPTVEILNGILYAVVYSVYSFSFISVILCLFFSALIILSYIDLDHMLVPDVINVFILILALFAIVLGDRPLIDHITGALVISLPMAILAYATKGFGSGDVILYFTSGLLVGFTTVSFSFVLACIIGSVSGIFMIATKKITRKQETPFVPSIAIGLIVSVLYGDIIIQWYTAFIWNMGFTLISPERVYLLVVLRHLKPLALY